MQEKKVKDIFSSISGKYDLANTLLSFGIEKYWRKRFSSHIRGNEKRILDACCGTGMSTFSLLNKIPKKNFQQTRIFGIDFSKEMLEVAEKRLLKLEASKDTPKISFSEADASNTSFEDNYFDLTIVVFGLRNIIERDKAIEEFYRITAPEGRLLIMEFNLPQKGIFSKLYRFYLNRILITIGKIITGEGTAYRHLAESIREFPNPEIIKDKLKKAGWKSVTSQSMTMGTCVIYCAENLNNYTKR
jgi:demethylmenaquinone methyltransferase / 2-methoxy-6-polyprenyl-1,4-benzoquinol methylase